MWKHNESGDRFVFEDLLRPGTSRIVVSGENWAEAAEVLVRLIDQEEREVSLIAIGRDLHGAADLPRRTDARLRIETSSPPAQLAIWSHSRPHSSDLWRRVLPQSLSGPIGEVRSITYDEPASVAEALASTALSGPLEEIASAWLGGRTQGDAMAAAIALLQHLALHPLDRSNKLGALVAALCQKQGTI
jgi:hypothetical protein